MKKILFVGPLPPPITGQSVAFSYLKKLDYDDLDLQFFNTQKSSFNFFNYLSSTLSLPFKILFSKYDLIYFVGSRSTLGFIRQIPLFLITILLGKKMINHLHGADFYNFYHNSGAFRPMIKFCYDNVYCSIVLLEGMKKEFKDFPEMKIEVVPNAFEPLLGHDQSDLPKPKHILYLSNLMVSKGIIEFLEATDLLLNDDKDLTISIAGSFIGDHIKKTNQIQQTFYNHYNPLKDKYKERINYFGVVEGEQKKQLLINSAIFILPTYYPTEAFPISILEAMSTGNAIITTRHNYLEELVTEENGNLIKTKSAKAIYTASKQMLNSQVALIKVQKHNINFAKQFSLESHLSKIKNIIHDAI